MRIDLGAPVAEVTSTIIPFNVFSDQYPVFALNVWQPFFSLQM